MEEMESQLAQMKVALALAEDADKPGIQMIMDQLQELLGAYAGTGNGQFGGGGNANAADNQEGSTSREDKADGEDDDEYKLFQSEIAALGSEDTSDQPQVKEDGNADTDHLNNGNSGSRSPPSDETSKSSIGNELEDLIGMKCMAPHQENWGQIGYYCAMISSVLSLEQGDSDDEPNDISSIMVRVIFMQPVVKSQLLCPFFKEDRCRFSDEDCNFSHGEVIPLSQLREYSEPDYSSIVPGSRVVAKYHDDLWYKATVQRITDEGECEVSYDVGNEALIIPLHETSPLNEAGDDDLSDDDLSEEDDVENPNLSSSESELDIPKTLLGDGLLEMKGGSALGDWEKFTKGMGSKLMLKMGYVFGTGLGKNKEGRVEPVDAIVLPPGKSLDACMNLKEKAKDGNLFSAEKRRLKLQRKAEKQRAKMAAQKPKEEANVFEFLNSKLALRKTSSNSNPSQKHSIQDLGKQTTSNLNKRLFRLDEGLRQVKKDILKTKESMKRQKGRDKETYSMMEKKLEGLESRRQELNTMQNTVAHEQKLRLEKRKLLSF